MKISRNPTVFRRKKVDANTDIIKGTAQKPTSSYLESTLDNNEAVQITDISLIRPDTKNVRIKATMSIPDILQKIYYSTCPKCFQLIKALGNEEFYCNTCNTNQIAVPRVELEDITGNITATLFDKCAEKLLQRTASKLHELDDQEIKILLANINKEPKPTKLIVEIRASNRKYTGKKTRYTVQEWIQYGINDASTSEKKDTTKQVEGTPDKQEGKKMRSTLQETLEPDSSKKDKRAHDATESAPIKRVKLEFPEKP